MIQRRVAALADKGLEEEVADEGARDDPEVAAEVLPGEEELPATPPHDARAGAHQPGAIVEADGERREQAGDRVAGQGRVEMGQHTRTEHDSEGEGDHTRQADQGSAYGSIPS